MFLESVINEFLVVQLIRGNSQRTVEYYTLSLNLFVEYVGNMDIEKLNLVDLQNYYIYLKSRGVSSVTIQTYIRALRAFLNWCYDEDYISVKLTDKFKLPKAKQIYLDVLSDYEIAVLFQIFDTKTFLGLRDYCICALMLDSGLRKNEVVTQSVFGCRYLDGYIIVNGKGNRQRVVPIGFNTRKHLMKWDTLIKNLDGDILFRKQDGEPITGNTIKQLFYRLKEVSGIKRLRPHLLRHTFATRFIENGGDVFTLQCLLGHTTLDMSRKYTHLSSAKMVERYHAFSPLDNIKKGRL